MRKMDGLQKLLYLIMVVLGIYILYKGSGLLLKKSEEQGAFDSGTVQRTLEDAALRTYLPGYTAAVEEYDAGSWMSSWMQQVVPVYSYLADGEAESEEVSSEQMVQDSSSEKSGEPSAQNNSDAEFDEHSSQNNIGETVKEQSMQSSVANNSGSAAAQSDGVEEDGDQCSQQENLNSVGEQPMQNGSAAKFDEQAIQGVSSESSDSELPQNSPTESSEETSVLPASAALLPDTLLEQLHDFDYLLSNYYIVDSGTSADAELLDADTLLNTDLSLVQNSDVPQILIYHTHSQEAFADSQEGNVDDTIVGMGEVLKEELEKFGYQVIHDTGVYDLVDGVLDRSAAYDYAREAVQQILEENPTIEVIIDLHRDGVEGQKFVTEIDGKPTSMIMFFNGISRNSSNESLHWLENPYIEENLAFTLQLQLKAKEQYPGFTRNIYLKAERFNLHLRPRSLLIEAGTQLNTVEEERNAMAPLADLIAQVLSGG